MSEIGAELLEAVRESYARFRAEDKQLRHLLGIIAEERGDYETAEQFAIKSGVLLSDALKRTLTPKAINSDTISRELAEYVLTPLLEEQHALVVTQAAAVQQALNDEANIALNVIIPGVNSDRITGLVDKISSYDSFTNGEWLLGEPIVNYSLNAVDETLRVNFKAQALAGYRPKIKRIAEPGCCRWCNALAGEYGYPVDREVFRRHERCRCVVLYIGQNKNAQDVHTKKLYQDAEQAEREARIDRVKKIEQAKAAQTEARAKRLQMIKAREKPLTFTPEFLRDSRKFASWNQYGGKFTIPKSEQQQLAFKLAGTGTEVLTKTGKARGVELVTAPKVIGQVYDPDARRYINTKRMAIIYTRHGTTVVPVDPGTRG